MTHVPAGAGTRPPAPAAPLCGVCARYPLPDGARFARRQCARCGTVTDCVLPDYSTPIAPRATPVPTLVQRVRAVLG